MNRQFIIYGIIILIIALMIYWYTTKTTLENLSSHSSQKENMTTEEVILNQPPKEKKDINNKKIKVMNFNTSWCKYSVMFAPEWAKLQTMVEDLNNPKIEVLDIKCDNPNNEAICDKYQVPGFPTVVFETDNNLEEYRGERSAEAIFNKIKTLV